MVEARKTKEKTLKRYLKCYRMRILAPGLKESCHAQHQTTTMTTEGTEIAITIEVLKKGAATHPHLPCCRHPWIPKQGIKSKTDQKCKRETTSFLGACLLGKTSWEAQRHHRHRQGVKNNSGTETKMIEHTFHRGAQIIGEKEGGRHALRQIPTITECRRRRRIRIRLVVAIILTTKICCPPLRTCFHRISPHQS